MVKNGKQRKGSKLKSKQRKQRPKKLKLGHAPGVEHFKVAAEVRPSHQTPT
jgi:transposase